jgi:hypothetical protein
MRLQTIGNVCDSIDHYRLDFVHRADLDKEIMPNAGEIPDFLVNPPSSKMAGGC